VSKLTFKAAIRGNDTARKDDVIRDEVIKGQDTTRAKDKDEDAIRKPRPEIMSRPGKNVQSETKVRDRHMIPQFCPRSLESSTDIGVTTKGHINKLPKKDQAWQLRKHPQAHCPSPTEQDQKSDFIRH
jgi:hypothetical protein